jgi:hypothetical protein
MTSRASKRTEDPKRNEGKRPALRSRLDNGLGVQMSTCAFCSKAAKISGEHIWSQWMRELFPSKRFRFFQRDESG